MRDREPRLLEELAPRDADALLVFKADKSFVVCFRNDTTYRDDQSPSPMPPLDKGGTELREGMRTVQCDWIVVAKRPRAVAVLSESADDERVVGACAYAAIAAKLLYLSVIRSLRTAS